MDPKALRERALEETTRFFLDANGILPDQDSEEWEEEYRRRFELVKQREAAKQQPAAAPPAAATRDDDRPAGGAVLNGPPAQQRWASTIRAARLKQIQSREIQSWIVTAWTAAKDWIDTRDLAVPMFLRRVEAEYTAHRRKSEAQAALLEAERQRKAAATETIQREIQAAGITAAGLAELIDISPRIAPAPITAKLAQLDVGARNLRIFEAGKVLMVLEKSEGERSEYGIERDEGLVADLKLFARGNPE
jgi:hypothetical protein